MRSVGGSPESVRSHVASASASGMAASNGSASIFASPTASVLRKPGTPIVISSWGTLSLSVRCSQSHVDNPEDNGGAHLEPEREPEPLHQPAPAPLDHRRGTHYDRCLRQIDSDRADGGNRQIAACAPQAGLHGSPQRPSALENRQGQKGTGDHAGGEPHGDRRGGRRLIARTGGLRGHFLASAWARSARDDL
jgi:hypothetical protein